MSGQYTASLVDMQVWAAGLMAQRAPDFVIGDPANPYLRRWWVIPRNDQCNVYLHEILRGDDDRAGHDHPWLNSSYIIDGGYTEVVYDEALPWCEIGRHQRIAGDVVTRSAEDTHRLIVPAGGRAVSLFMTGPKTRDWGFWCPGDERRLPRWVDWRSFTNPDSVGEVGVGCA
jgi:hypothetical protein